MGGVFGYQNLLGLSNFSKCYLWQKENKDEKYFTASFIQMPDSY